ncbi:MAG: hypothetical protein DWQ08_07060 [Proteobacteria bacterium]|nr:MAG: hypothetical protein DWQ08_07060 [Pseudomonadota bacterium]
MAKQRLKRVATSMGSALMLMLGATTHADDTEVYIGIAETSDNVNPNVLFIIDTSGSMDTDVEITTDFDPSVTYGGGSGQACANNDNVFYSSNADEPPSCNSASRFDRDDPELVCAPALAALFDGPNITGRYTDQIGIWRNRSFLWWSWSEWTSSFDGGYGIDPVLVECEDDRGVHGATTGGPSWPVSTNGPFQSTPNGSPWTQWPTRTLFSANYLRWYWYHSQTTSQTRLEIVQDVAKDLVDSVSEINIGLMRFDTTGGDYHPTHSWGSDRQGGLVVYPMRDIDATGIRTQFKSAVDGLNASGYTPLAETLYEAMLYYRGGEVKYGHGNNGRWSHSSSRSGSTYLSPIDYECSKNYVVFLTDGLPNTDNDADDEINALLANTSGLTLGSCNNGVGTPIDNCLDELAEYMYETDSANAATGNDLVGKQNITTYTVGFNVDDDGILESAARQGGGKYYTANTAQQLTNAFTQIIEDILRVNTTFTSPAVAVNAFNRLTHKNELYFTVFQPDDRPHWAGNVKKFRIDYVTDGQGNQVDENNDGEADIAIFDANGNLAVDDATGFFSETSRSLWTPSDFAPDGDQAGKGGFASRLYDYSDTTNQHTASTRASKIYTFTNSSDGGDSLTDLTAAENALHENNAYIPIVNEDGKITKDMMNAPSITDDEFLRLLKYARGLDVTDQDSDGSTLDGRPSIGAPLHTRPHLVTYHIDTQNNTQTDYLFIVTNDGYIHMVPTQDPEGTATPSSGDRMENWAFVPPDKLTNIRTLFDNIEASNITYGVDGGLDVWVKDSNGDYDILDDDGNVDSGDHAYLYFGQRRGGTHYYALDVSDPDQPEYLWSATSDGAAASNPLSKFGQTWSRPRHTEVFFKEVGNSTLTRRDVLIVGGGYDTSQDSQGARSPDSTGNAIFILDATDGEVLWWTSTTPQPGAAVPDLVLTDMNYSFPADIRIVDLNGDGITDRFFAADMGGQVWRFDIANDTADTLKNRITGGRIADLQKSSAQSGTPGESDNRRFYYPPDVALIVPDSGAPFHSIAVGSGYRAHPNDTAIQDRIYVIKDTDIAGPPVAQGVEYTTLYEGDLLDVTDILDSSNLTESQQDKLENGWFVSLAGTGEKALASALTVDKKVLITTFIPADQTSTNLNDVCAPSQGTARLYALNAVDGRPVANLDFEGGDQPEDFTLRDRYYELTRQGIAPEVTIIFPEDTSLSPIPIVGTELVPELKVDNDPEATYWYQHNVH